MLQSGTKEYSCLQAATQAEKIHPQAIRLDAL